MPYIPKERRNPVLSDGPANAGELNFMLTTVVRAYLRDKGKSYQTMNDIVGALENCKDEFKRRIQHPYENDKIKINGDVYS